MHTRARAVSEKEWLPTGLDCLSLSSWLRRDPTVHFSFVPLASHLTQQGEVDITSSLTIKKNPGTSKKEDLDDPLKLVAVFALPLKTPTRDNRELPANRMPVNQLIFGANPMLLNCPRITRMMALMAYSILLIVWVRIALMKEPLLGVREEPGEEVPTTRYDTPPSFRRFK
ncbi:hypothetical protein ACFE04_019645 [Oxalis oulophora]